MSIEVLPKTAIKHTQTVSSASTTAHYLPQTSTGNMDELPQNRPNSYRCYTCSHGLIVLSMFMTSVGAINILAGSGMKETWLKKQGQIQMNAGIGVLVTAVVVLILSTTWCCYVRYKLRGSWHPSRATSDATNYNANASNIAFTLEEQPPISHGPGRLPTFEYSYQQQVQTGTNQYTPALPTVILNTPEQTTVNHFQVAQFALNHFTPAQLSLNQLPPAQTAINRYPSDPADQPPPSYNEVIGGSSFI